ncbi:MAG: hypothetical protein U0236_18380 [Nitrospira sp.]
MRATPSRLAIGLRLILAGALVGLASSATAQTFSSGSTGALGAFNPAVNTTVTLPADGILNYTTVNVPVGVTVTFLKNAANTPVTLLATGNVTVAGVVHVNGSVAAPCSGGGQAPGGAGGPGGFDGGRGGAMGVVNTEGSVGQGPGGGALAGHGIYGAPGNFVALLPLFGGSGATGSNGNASACGLGGSGGGGAIVIASSTQISVTGAIRANGGPQPPVCATGLSGSGGALRLVAPFITIPTPGTLEAKALDNGSSPGCVGGSGRIRLEAFTFGVVPTTTPAASLSTTPGPVTAASTPALTSVPTVKIASVAGVAAPTTPTGSYSTPDLTLAVGTSNPVTVTLNATNTPVGSVFQVKAMPPSGAAVVVNSAPSTGTVAASTATATLTLPTGVTSVLNVYGSYVLTP